MANNNNELYKLRELVQKQSDALEAIFSGVMVFGTIVAESSRNGSGDKKKSWVVATGIETLDVIDNSAVSGLRPGRAVKLIRTDSGYSIAETADRQPIGRVAFIHAVYSNGQVEVDFEGGTKCVSPGSVKDLAVGGKAIIDESGSVVLENLGRADRTHVFERDTGVDFHNIAGLEDAKQTLIEAIELPLKHAALYASYNRSNKRGVLLYGPPGNGKTMLGRAAATAAARATGQSGGFLYIRGPELLDKFVGATEAKIRGLFQSAREFKRQTGAPAVIFIDEAESLLSKRGSGVSSDVDKTIVPQFLSEMDGLEDSAAIVILATNRPELLDSAVVRDGRVDAKIEVPGPTPEVARKVASLTFGNVSVCDKEETLSEIVSAIYDDKKLLYEVHTKQGRRLGVTWSEIVSCAGVAGIVNGAIDAAIRRDVQGSATSATGVTRDDVVYSLAEAWKREQRMEHREQLDSIKKRIQSHYAEEASGVRKVAA